MIGQADDGSCTQTEKSCSAIKTLTTREHPLQIFPLSKGKKLKLTWVLDFGGTLQDCIPNTADNDVSNTLAPDVDYSSTGKPGTLPYSYVQTTSVATLKRGKTRYTLSGSVPVKGTGYTGTLQYHANVVLKRVRIAESCKLVKRQGFTCTL